jgi:hypothetical protein
MREKARFLGHTRHAPYRLLPGAKTVFFSDLPTIGKSSGQPVPDQRETNAKMALITAIKILFICNINMLYFIKSVFAPAAAGTENLPGKNWEKSGKSNQENKLMQLIRYVTNISKKPVDRFDPLAESIIYEKF